MDPNIDDYVGESQGTSNRRGDLGAPVGDPLPSQRHLGHQTQGHYGSPDMPPTDPWGAPSTTTSSSSQARAPASEPVKQHVSDSLPNIQAARGDHQNSPPLHASGNTTTATTPTSTTTGSSVDSTGGDHHSPTQHPVHTAPATIPESESNPSLEHRQESWSQNPGDHAHHNMVSSTDFRQVPPIEYSRAESAPGSFQHPSLEHQGSSSNLEYSSAIKLLVSNNVAGSIIGRSGQTIIELQAQTSTRIKLSQSGDYYPGTQDRICLVQGHPGHVKNAASLILTRLFALQQQQHYHHFPWQNQQQQSQQASQEGGPTAPTLPGMVSSSEDPNLAAAATAPATSAAGAPSTFAFVVRLLVPIPSCGMIIGKGGINVKHMVESSGVSSVRLSPKEGTGGGGAAAAAMVSATSERVVTLTGADLDSCIKCMSIILDGMALHPEISRYTNMTTSYSRVLSAAHAAQAAAVAAAAVAARVAIGVPPSSATAANRSTPDQTGVVSSAVAHSYGGMDSSGRSGMPSNMGLWDQQQERTTSANMAHPAHGPPPSSLRGAASPAGFDSLHLSQAMFPDHSIETIVASSAPVSPHFRARETMPSYSPVFGGPAPGTFLQSAPPPDVVTQNTAAAAAAAFHQSPSRHHAQSHHSAAIAAASQGSAGVYMVPPSPVTYAAAQGGIIGADSHNASRSTSAPDLLALQMQDALRVSDLQQQQQQHPSFLSPGMASASIFQGGGRHQHHQHHLSPPQIASAQAAAAAAAQSAAASNNNPANSAGGGFTAQVAIPDSLIGSILGRGGRTLNELMMLSNSKIRISQRGEYVPGTKNRIVTIRGPTAQSVTTAQFLMSQRMVVPPTAATMGQQQQQPPTGGGAQTVQLHHPLQPMATAMSGGQPGACVSQQAPAPKPQQQDQKPQQPQAAAHHHRRRSDSSGGGADTAGNKRETGA